MYKNIKLKLGAEIITNFFIKRTEQNGKIFISVHYGAIRIVGIAIMFLGIVLYFWLNYSMHIKNALIISIPPAGLIYYLLVMRPVNKLNREIAQAMESKAVKMTGSSYSLKTPLLYEIDNNLLHTPHEDDPSL
jgi:hypothetical protein